MLIRQQEEHPSHSVDMLLMILLELCTSEEFQLSPTLLSLAATKSIIVTFFIIIIVM